VRPILRVVILRVGASVMDTPYHEVARWSTGFPSGDYGKSGGVTDSSSERMSSAHKIAPGTERCVPSTA
jgi:hypothetical protein